jgi:hypothetical protein
VNPQPIPQGEKLPAVRKLKCTLPDGEFGAAQWAAKRVLVRHPNGKLGAIRLEEFMRGALLARVRETVRGEVERGKAIPPDIAHIVSTARTE